MDVHSIIMEGLEIPNETDFTQVGRAGIHIQRARQRTYVLHYASTHASACMPQCICPYAPARKAAPGRARPRQAAPGRDLLLLLLLVCASTAAAASLLLIPASLCAEISLLHSRSFVRPLAPPSAPLPAGLFHPPAPEPSTQP